MKAVVLALALGWLAIGLPAWDEESAANRAYRRGDYERAAEGYREAIAEDGSTPEREYNLGTALLRTGETTEAREHLEAALEARSPELRARAFYNLGNARVAGGEASREALEAAVDAYRRSLLLDPGNEDVRWNLELALRRLERQEESSQPLPGPEDDPTAPPRGGPESGAERPESGGEVGVTPREPGGGQGEAPVPPGLQEPLPLELAEQILRAVEERERGLQREKLRRERKRVRGPDW